MNLSADAIEASDGGEGEKPDYVGEIQIPVKRGYQTGSPVVGDPIKVGDEISINEAYDHYPRRDDLIKPSSGDFLKRLFDSDLVNSIEHASTELNTHEKTVRKAIDLHDIDAPDTSEHIDIDRGNERKPYIELPSGERWSKEILTNPPYQDGRILSQLLAMDGLSIEETVIYLNQQCDDDISENDLRLAARKFGLL